MAKDVDKKAVTRDENSSNASLDSSLRQFKVKNRYFPHDVTTNSDEKIAEMMYYFRHHKEIFDSSILPYAALGVFWTIIQHLYTSSLSKEKLHVFADDKRISLKFLQTVLDNFNLFKEQDGYYINERVLEEIKKMKEASSKARANANKRWKTDKKEKTEEEKALDKQADDFLRRAENIVMHQELSQYDEYRTLEITEQQEAITYFQEQLKTFSKKTAIKNLLEHIKKEKS